VTSPARWHDAVATFLDFAIVTFTVDPGALRALLPGDVVPDVFTLSSGTPAAFVSAVSFRARRFHLRALAWPRASFPQTNYRAYVRVRGERGVWFLGTSLGSALAVLPRRLWGLPWHRDRIALEADWQGERCLRYSLRTDGWGEAELETVGRDQDERLDGFTDEHQAREVLTHPLIGYFPRSDGQRVKVTVWHPPLAPRQGDARRARFAVFERAGLVQPGQAPHSVLLQRETQFVTFLPPKRE
jgi:hypothetical protein